MLIFQGVRFTTLPKKSNQLTETEHVFSWNLRYLEKPEETVTCLHPGRLTAGTYKSPIWKGK